MNIAFVPYVSILLNTVMSQNTQLGPFIGRVGTFLFT